LTPGELKSRIESEIAGELLSTNAHGCDLKKCLVTPIKRQYEDAGNPSDPSSLIQLWLVLEKNRQQVAS
jgi:hypothetical protein